MEVIDVIVEGNRRIVRATFLVPPRTGVKTDPTTTTFTARRRRESGDAATAYAPKSYVFGTDVEVQRAAGEAVGVFELSFVPAQGTWHVYVKGTGAAEAAGEVTFVVKRAEALTT